MADHHHTAMQALRKFRQELKKPENFRVTHYIDSVISLPSLGKLYDFFILYRDCTLQRYHGKKRVPEFEMALKQIANKSELVSNSSFDEFLRIRDIYGNLFPISNLVRFNDGATYLIRSTDNDLQVLKYDSESSSFEDQSVMFKGLENAVKRAIKFNYKKPDPLILKAVIAANIHEGRVPEKPYVLMVGDRYLTDIVCGNLAGVDTALVKPYKPFSDKPALILTRYLYDIPQGVRMNKKLRGR